MTEVARFRCLHPKCEGSNDGRSLPTTMEHMAQHFATDFECKNHYEYACFTCKDAWFVSSGYGVSHMSAKKHQVGRLSGDLYLPELTANKKKMYEAWQFYLDYYIGFAAPVHKQLPLNFNKAPRIGSVQIGNVPRASSTHSSGPVALSDAERFGAFYSPPRNKVSSGYVPKTPRYVMEDQYPYGDDGEAPPTYAPTYTPMGMDQKGFGAVQKGNGPHTPISSPPPSVAGSGSAFDGAESGNIVPTVRIELPPPPPPPYGCNPSMPMNNAYSSQIGNGAVGGYWNANGAQFQQGYVPPSQYTPTSGQYQSYNRGSYNGGRGGFVAGRGRAGFGNRGGRGDFGGNRGGFRGNRYGNRNGEDSSSNSWNSSHRNDGDDRAIAVNKRRSRSRSPVRERSYSRSVSRSPSPKNDRKSNDRDKDARRPPKSPSPVRDRSYSRSRSRSPIAALKANSPTNSESELRARSRSENANDAPIGDSVSVGDYSTRNEKRSLSPPASPDEPQYAESASPSPPHSDNIAQEVEVENELSIDLTPAQPTVVLEQPTVVSEQPTVVRETAPNPDKFDTSYVNMVKNQATQRPVSRSGIYGGGTAVGRRYGQRETKFIDTESLQALGPPGDEIEKTKAASSSKKNGKKRSSTKRRRSRSKSLSEGEIEEETPTRKRKGKSEKKKEKKTERRSSKRRRGQSVSEGEIEEKASSRKKRESNEKKTEKRATRSRKRDHRSRSYSRSRTRSPEVN